MRSWTVTPALSRALLVGVVLVGAAVLLGEPVLVVLAAPLVVLAALGLVHRPTSTPVVRGVLGHGSLYEGQGTRSRLLVTEADGVEHVTRLSAQAPYVALHPASGRVSGLLRHGVPDLEISPRRWGRRTLGEEKVALTSPWAGYRWGPVLERGSEMTVLPASAPFDSATEAPQPLGLVGANRSRRPGDGTEFAGIRPFHAGDRLRRINWRVSLRTGDLHVVTSRGEEDSGVLLVVDALADFGRSGGVDGGASSLDVTMRAASALAEHFAHHGDRVSLRVVGGAWEVVGYGSGKRHLRRVLGRLAGVRPARLRDDADGAAAPRRYRRHGRDRALAPDVRSGRAWPRPRCTGAACPCSSSTPCPSTRRRSRPRGPTPRWPTSRGACAAPSATSSSPP